MSKFYYGHPKNIISDICEIVGNEWGFEEIVSLAKMIKTHPCAPYYVADRQPVKDAIAEAIRESGRHGDLEAMEKLAIKADWGLENAIEALAEAVTIDSTAAGESVACHYLRALTAAV